MGYLFTQIFFCLLLAFLLGMMIGWLLRGLFGGQEERATVDTSEIDTLRAQLRAKDTALNNARGELDKCNQALAASQKATPTQMAAPVAGDVTKVAERDDLKKIFGIGPYLERVLNANSIYSYRQIAKLTDKHIDELSEKIGPFRERIRRDNWIEGAREQFKKKYGKDVD